MPRSLSLRLSKLSLLLALMVGFFIITTSAQAATLFGPDGAVVGNAAEYSTGLVDASGYENINLSFNYNAEALDKDDSFVYGWRSGSDTDIATIVGVPEGVSAIPGDETGLVNLYLPESAAVSDLEVYVRVTAGSAIRYDFVEVTNLLITGDLLPPTDEDDDGIVEGDYCPGTTEDVAGNDKLNPNHWRYDGSILVKALTGKGKGNTSAYTVTDTRGCSCDQILDILTIETGEEYGGQRKFGCTAGTLEEFMEFVW